MVFDAAQTKSHSATRSNQQEEKLSATNTRVANYVWFQEENVLTKITP